MPDTRDPRRIAEILGRYPTMQGPGSRIEQFPEIMALPEEQRGARMRQEANVGELLRMLATEGGINAPAETYGAEKLERMGQQYPQPETEERVLDTIMRLKEAYAARQAPPPAEEGGIPDLIRQILERQRRDREALKDVGREVIDRTRGGGERL